MGVSIRAPAWGATSTSRQYQPVLGSFQSARPRGARPRINTRTRKAWSFNPRARVGRDPDQEMLAFINRVSIRAPAWGAT